jgi:hypothetical protein
VDDVDRTHKLLACSNYMNLLGGNHSRHLGRGARAR